jgi:hypothetical protein
VGRHKAAAAGGVKLVMGVLTKMDRMDTSPGPSYNADTLNVHKQVLYVLSCGFVSSLSNKSSELQSKLGNAGISKYLFQFVESQLANYFQGSSPVPGKIRGARVAGLLAARAFAAVLGDRQRSSSSPSWGSGEETPGGGYEVSVSSAVMGSQSSLTLLIDEFGIETVGELGWLSNTNLSMESLRAISCLSNQHEANRSKFVNGPVADILAQFLNDFPASKASEADILLKSLATLTVDVLVGKHVQPGTPSPTGQQAHSGASSNHSLSHTPSSNSLVIQLSIPAPSANMSSSNRATGPLPATPTNTPVPPGEQEEAGNSVFSPHMDTGLLNPLDSMVEQTGTVE